MPFNDVTGSVLGEGCSCNVHPLDVKLTPCCLFLTPLQNKEFVCRGHDYERLEAFQQRMLNEFPHAIAMQHVNQPDQTIYQADAQCILGNREQHIQIHSLRVDMSVHAGQAQSDVWKCIQIDCSAVHMYMYAHTHAARLVYMYTKANSETQAITDHACNL